MIMTQSTTPHSAVPKPWVDTIFRVFSSLIFLVAALGHIRAPDAIAQRLENAEIGAQIAALLPAVPLVVLSGVVMLIGGIALAIGFKTRLSALVLIACLIPITIAVQLEPNSTGPLFKNISIFGSLIYIAAHGPLGFGVDRVTDARAA